MIDPTKSNNAEFDPLKAPGITKPPTFKPVATVPSPTLPGPTQPTIGDPTAPRLPNPPAREPSGFKAEPEDGTPGTLPPSPTEPTPPSPIYQPPEPPPPPAPVAPPFPPPTEVPHTFIPAPAPSAGKSAIGKIREGHRTAGPPLSPPEYVPPVIDGPLPPPDLGEFTQGEEFKPEATDLEGAPHDFTLKTDDQRRRTIEDLKREFVDNPDVNVGNIEEIDPEDDLRSSTILPGDDPALQRAYDGTQAATTALDTFDRQALVNELLQRNAGPDVPDINPADDLRASLISDADDARTTGYAGKVDEAAGKLPGDIVGRSNTLRDEYLAKLGNTDIDVGPDISTAGSDRLNKYGSMLDESVNGLNAVDRVQMAKDLFRQFQEAREPEYELAAKRATKRAAATGGLRSGQLRTDYGNLELARARDNDLEQRRLISQALNDSIGDQYNKADFLRGTETSLAGREAGLRDERRTDRSFKTGVAEGNVNRRSANLGTATVAGSNLAGAEADSAYRGLDALRTLEGDSRASNAQKIAGRRTERANQFSLSDRKRSNFESNRSNANNQADAASSDLGRRFDANRGVFDDVSRESRAQRNEYRGERGYEGDMENQAFQRRLAQYETEQREKDRRFNRGITLMGAGESGNPSATLARLAEENGLDPMMIAQLAASMGNRGGGGGGGGGDGFDLGDITGLLQGLFNKKKGVNGVDTIDDGMAVA